MTSLYPNSPDNSKLFITNIQDNLQQLDNSKKPSKNPQQLKIQDVFLVVKKGSVKTIEKHSFQGIWLSFKQKVAKFFNKDSELSTSKKNLTERIKHLNLSRFDQTSLTTLHEIEEALHIGSTDQIAQKALDGLKASKTPSSIEGKVKLSSEQPQTDHIKKVTEDLDLLDQAITKLGIFEESEQLVITQFLKTYANAPQLLEAHQKKDEDQFIHLLHLAVLKATELAPDDKFDQFESALKKITAVQSQLITAVQPQLVPLSSTAPTIENLALVLGDSFIEKSGLEGDVNSLDYAKFMVEYLKSRDNISPEAERLCYTLENALDFRDGTMSAGDLRAKIKEVIDNCPAGPNGEKRCLFVGGWNGHAVVFEMEKKANGKFAFRVYNQGEGVDAHEKIEVGLKTKHSCFYSVDDIDEKVMLKRSFLASLQSLSTFDQGQDVLYDQILKTLGNKREVVDGSFQQFIQIQRAGTCVYRSLQSFIARSLTQNDYPVFKFEYKLFMLKKYLPELRAKASTTPGSAKEYSERILDYNTLSKMVQKFSDEIQKNSASIDPKDLLDAKIQLADYKVLLKRIEKNLHAFEAKTISTDAKAPLVEIPASTFIDPLKITKTASLNVDSAKLTTEASSLLEVIHKLNKPLDLAQIEDVLFKIWSSRLQSTELSLVLDSLFKEIGPLENFEKIPNPGSISSLMATINGLFRKLQGSDVNLEKRAMFGLALYYLAECAYKKAPQGEKVLLENFSFLASMKVSNLEKVVHLDPYWSDFMEDLGKKVEDQDIVPYSPPSHINNPNGTYSLSRPMITNIMTYWKNLNPAFLQQVDESIIQDRKNQEIEIDRREKAIDADIEFKKREIVDLEAKKSQLSQTLGTLDPKYTSAEAQYFAIQSQAKSWNTKEYDRYQRERNDYYAGSSNTPPKDVQPFGRQNELNTVETTYNNLKRQVDDLTTQIYYINQSINNKSAEIQQLQLNRAAVRSQVENDPRYWPKGWETDAFSDDAKAMFIFANSQFFKQKMNVQTILPEAFYDFFACATRAAHIFYPVEDFRVSYEKEPNKFPTLKVASQNNVQPFSRWSLSTALPSFDKNWKPLFEAVGDASQEIENNAPVVTVECFAKIPSKDRAISTEEMREILAFNPKDVRIESLIAFFEENWEKLDDENWLLILYSSLFESHVLLDALRDPNQPQVAEKIEAFFEKVQRNALSTNNFKLIGNLMMMKGSFKRCLNHIQPDRPVDNDLKEVHTILEKALNDEFKSQWPVLFQGLAAYCSQLPISAISQSGNMDIPILVNALTMQFPPTNVPHRDLRNTLAANLQLNLKEYFTLAPDFKALEIFLPRSIALLKTVFPRMGIITQLDQRDSLGIKTEGGLAVFCLSSGVIVTNDALLIEKYHARPRQAILDELVEIGLFSNEDTKMLRCQEEPPHTYIKDLKTGFIIIKSGNNYYREIKTSGKTEWMKYVPKDSKQLPNLELNERYHHFKSGVNTYICDKKTFECLYTVSNKAVGLSALSSQRYCITDVETGFELANSKLFTSFEDASCSLFWVDSSKTLQKIEFPRMHLSFKRDAQGLMQCVEKPGWSISEEQFAPYIGAPTGFLTLEDADGRKKILLPEFDSIETKAQNALEKTEDALNFPFAYDFTTGEREVRYLECELKENSLIPTTLEARYHLAYLYLEKGFTQLAEELLFSNQAEVTSRGLTREERAILENMVFTSKSKEVSGQKVRVQLHALYLLENDALTHKENKPEPIDPKVVKQRQDAKEILIEKYLKRLGHIKPLEQREEVLILKNTVSYSNIIRTRQASFGIAGSSPKMGSAMAVSSDRPRFVKHKIERGWTIDLDEIKPEFAVRFQYFRARLSNTFPFDYTNTDELKIGFKKYGYCIVQEALSTKSLKSAKNNGLLFLCSYMTLNPQGLEKELLARIVVAINELNGETAGVKPASGTPLTSQLLPKSNLGAIEKETAELNMLAVIQPSIEESSFLPALSEQYLEKTQIMAQKPQTKLFAENTPEITDLARKTQFTAMRKDLVRAAELLGEELVYAQDGMQNFETLISTLENEFNEQNQTLVEQEQLLLTAVHSALTSQVASDIQFKSGKRKLPSIQDLCVLCSKVDGDTYIKKLYPELSDSAITNLRAGIQAYLVQKQFVQHLGRAKQQALNVQAENDPSSKQILLNELGKSLDAPRCYTDDDPLALVFLSIETILNIKLREDQISNIKDFYKAQQGGEELVVQMIMGAGKTSVIQPILAFLFATPELLSTVTVPGSLFHAVNEELSKLLGASFDLFVFSNPFTKKLAQTSEYLRTYLDRLEEAQSRGCAVLLTPQHKYAIYSSLKEAYYLNDRARVELLTKICNLLQVKELAQIDEIDMVMDPSIIYKFPLGEKTPIDGVRASAVTEFLMTLINDQTFSDEIALDFITQLKKRQDPTYVPKGNELSDDLYKTRVAPKLVDIAFKQFMEKLEKDGIVPDKTIQNYIKSFLGKTTEFDQALSMLPQGDEVKITERLSSKTIEQLQALSTQKPSTPETLVASKLLFIKTRDAALKKFFNQEDRDYLGVLSKSINKILKKSLFEEGGTHYSNDPEKGVYTVRPYYAPNSPKPSVPSDPYEMLIKSIQNAFYNGIPREAVEKIFASWQSAAIKESKEFNIEIFDTDAYKKFEAVIGADDAKNIRFTEKPPKKEMLDLLEQKMNQDPSSIEDFVRKYITKQVGFYSKSIETTPQTLAGLSFKAFGYTGTINEGILTLTMKGKPEVGTDGKTITVVDRKIALGGSELKEFEASKVSYPNQIIQQFKDDPDFYVVTDSGNWLKEEQLPVWVERLFKEVSQDRKNIQGVIYPNAAGEWLSMEYENGALVSIPLRDSKLKPDQRLTVIPSKHETGTNIRQIPTAKVLNTVRKDMTLRDALQSIFRMRQILQGQQIVLGVSKEVKDHIVTLLIQDIMQNDPYRTYLNDFLIHGNQPAWGNNPLDNWLKDAFAQAGNPPSFGAILTAGSALFKLSDQPETLWNYLLKNQIEDKLSKNALSLDHQMSEVIEKPIRMVLNDPKVPYEERKALFDAMGTFFTPEQKDSPFEEMAKSGQKIPIDTAIEQKIQRLMQFYSKLQGSPSLGRVKENIETLYGQGKSEEVLEKTLKSCVKKDILPEYLGGSDNSAEIEQDQELELEVEEEALVQVDIEAKILIATEPKDLKRYDYKPLNNAISDKTGYNPAYFNGAKFSKTIDLVPTKAPKIRKMLGDFPLEFSPNLFLDGALASSYALPSNYLLMTKKPGGGYRYVLISHEDAGKIQKGMLHHKDPQGNACALVSFDKKVVSTFGDTSDIDQAELTKAILFSKLVTGKVNFKKDEIELIKKFITESDDPKALLVEMKVLLENILSFKPTSAHEYENSSIKRLIYDMMGINKKMVKAA